MVTRTRTVAWRPVLLLSVLVLLCITLMILIARASDDRSTVSSTSIDALAALRQAQDRPYYPWLDTDTLSVGLYELPAGGTDRQSPHKQDEIYYIAAGRALLTAGEEEIPVEPGSVVYVKRQIPHRFHSITEDLQVLVFFSKAEGK